MGKKKLFKRLLAVVMALVLSNVFTTVERAEAASCPPHREYYEEEVGAVHNGYQHKVRVPCYIKNANGAYVTIGNNTEEKRYVWCTVTFFDVCVSVRCKNCDTEIARYYYRPDEGEEKHSICPAEEYK